MITFTGKIKGTNYVKLKVIKPDPQLVLFISGNGPLDSTTLIDNSMYNRTITTDFGTYTYKNDYVRNYPTSVVGSSVGAWSANIPTPGVDQSWTWEMWIYLTNDQIANSGNGFGFLSLDQNSNNIIMSTGIGSGAIRFALIEPWVGRVNALTTGSIQANQWTHIAMSSKDNGNGTGTLRSFINGNLEGTYTGTIFPMAINGIIRSGFNAPTGFSNPNYYFTDYRIIQGRAEYISNFTPT